MRRLRDLPITQKLVVVMVLTSSFALVLATLGFTANEVAEFRRLTTARVSSLANILGENSAGALAFADPTAATRVVNSVAGQSLIVNACLYVPDGPLLAGFQRDTGTPCPVDAQAFSAVADGYLIQLHEVSYEGDQVGLVGLKATRQELLADLQGYFAIVAVLMVLAFFASWALAARLQGLISGPVLHLVSVAKAVMQEKNYSMRASPASRDEVGVLSRTFNEMLDQIEGDVEDRKKRESMLGDTNRQLRQQQEFVKNILGSMIDMLVVVSPDGRIATVNDATWRHLFTTSNPCKLLSPWRIPTLAQRSSTSALMDSRQITMLGYREDELVGQPAQILFADNADNDGPTRRRAAGGTNRSRQSGMLDTLLGGGQVNAVEGAYRTKDGQTISVSFSGAVMRNWDGEIQGIVCVAQDSTERKQLQFELEQAHKLESVGQLAAGIAHEINTPTQYLGDNARFLKEAFADLRLALAGFERLRQAAKTGRVDAQLLAELETTLQQTEVEYLTTEIPKAIDQSITGVEQVAKIVLAMKEFTHPGGEQKSLVNLPQSLETTITVAGNEWKYVAEIVTDFDPDLPDVMCRPSELNQVFLNLIVNAAQAIGESLGEEGTDRGTITVGTRCAGPWAEIFVRDTGPGMSDEVRARVFDPFFTTKDVGKGTGQGLAIARSVVVDKHGGTIDCESEPGRGTTFTVRIPMRREEDQQPAVLANEKLLA